MICSDDDKRVVELAGLSEEVENPSDLKIHLARKAEIDRSEQSDIFGVGVVERLGVSVDTAVDPVAFEGNGHERVQRRRRFG